MRRWYLSQLYLARSSKAQFDKIDSGEVLLVLSVDGVEMGGAVDGGVGEIGGGDDLLIGVDGEGG